MTARLRAAAAVLLVGAMTAGFTATTRAAASTSDTGTAARQLAERYAPIVMLRRYDGVCGDSGEPYVPMTVDKVLGNPEVALRQLGNADPVIMWAPTAKDLYGRGEGVYLDLPGDALRPECVYSDYSARYTPLSDAAVYAHVVQQADHPEFLAVQYWLYWYYNDWNDKHESDWEFIQILFRASSADEALTKSPDSVGYAQHNGGETAAWTDSKLRREGSHPVLYASENSHASYFEPALFLGRGSTEGFGCDNTQGPSTRVAPRVVLLPDTPANANDPAAWLTFRGRWGERQPAPNNGPTGPASKPRWADPVSWQQGLRPSSFVVPGGEAAAPSIITIFCKAVGGGSVLLIHFLASPVKVGVALIVVAALITFFLRRTSWRLVEPLPVVARRRAGEAVRAAWTLFRRRPLTFTALGIWVLPIAVICALLTAVATHLPVIGSAVTVTETDDTAGRVLIAATIAAALWPLTVLLAAAGIAVVLGAGHGMTAGDGLRGVRRHARQLATAFFPRVLVIALLSISVVGAPIAVLLTVRSQFLAQVVVFEGVGGLSAIRRSRQLCRHRWWYIAVITTLVWSVVIGVDIAIALLLLVTATGLPIWVISGIALLCQVFLVPLGALMMTLVYGDARARTLNAVGVAALPA
ncbi:MAG: Vps62-related protein [Actinomycetes bacterium]